MKSWQVLSWLCSDSHRTSEDCQLTVLFPHEYKCFTSASVMCTHHQKIWKSSEQNAPLKNAPLELNFLGFNKSAFRMSLCWYSTKPARCWRRFNFLVWQGTFLPVNFQCRLPYMRLYNSLRAIACIYICVHVKDLVVHVRVQRIMQTLKHQAYTSGWAVQLCYSWLSQGKQLEFPMEKSDWEIWLWKKYMYRF